MAIVKMMMYDYRLFYCRLINYNIKLFLWHFVEGLIEEFDVVLLKETPH